MPSKSFKDTWWVFVIFSILVLLLLLLIVVVIPDGKKAIRDTADINHIIYFKDPRTNICFAYVWTGASNGGGSLSTVNCESVSRFLTKIPNFEYSSSERQL